MTTLNRANPSVRRILKEVSELQRERSWQLAAAPLDDNLFEWHFTLRGAPDSPFERGVYHGRILLPQDYPFKPPNIVLLTPNGRFEVGKKICLSISAHHPESWRPSWSIRTALVALIGFFPTEGNGAIGALDYPDDERRKLARESLAWSCAQCGVRCADALPERPADGSGGDLLRDVDVSEIHISKVPPRAASDDAAPADKSPVEPADKPPVEPADAAADAAAATAPAAARSAVARPAERHAAAAVVAGTPAESLSFGSMLVYFLVTCIAALVARKFVLVQ